jgi:predicted ArsR family transcriptional regulator
MLVLAILGQNHLKALLAGETDARTPGTPFGITASRIADVTDMPRQTVRRKLQDLARRGWLTQNSDAAWVLVGPPDDTAAGQDLAELSQRGLDRAVRLRDDLNRILGPAKGL